MKKIIHFPKFTKAFTLLELLVVISILGVLASVFLATFPSSMKSVRDNIRKHDLDVIRKGLEQYWDIYGHYPPEGLCTDTSVGCGGCGCSNSNYPNGSDWDQNSDLRDLVAEGYLGKIPVDPINDSTYYYRYEPDGNGQHGCQVNSCQWSLCARLETTGQWYCVYSVRNSDDFPKGAPY